MAPRAFLSALLLLAPAGGAAIEVSSLSRSEATDTLELGPELDDKAKHSTAHKAKDKSSPALHEKATHSHTGHNKAHHSSTHHSTSQHSSTHHSTSKHSSSLHSKVNHSHSHTLKSHHSTELHGKTKHSSGLHSKVTHSSTLHQKSKHNSTLHEKATHGSALHGKTEAKTKAKTGSALHGKAAKTKEKTGHDQKKKEAEAQEAVEEEAQANDADAADVACEDVVNGSVCFTAVSWLRSDGFKKHPDWYPAYGADSTFREVQAMLYSLGKSKCPKPCMSLEGDKGGDTGKVLELDASGRQVYSEGHRLAQTNKCKDAVEGEYCFSSILWLAAKGVKKHPEWYPHLSLDSSFRDAQEELFRDNKSDCTRPCLTESNAAKQFRLDAEKKSKTKKAKINLAKLLNEKCLDVEPKTTCHIAVMHALKEGIKKEPDSYPGLPARADFRDVQENLFLHGKSECPKPCPATDPAEAAVNSTDAEGPKRVQDMTLTELVEYIEAQRTTTSTAPKADPEEVGGVKHYDPQDQDMRNETESAEGANASSAEAPEAAQASLVSAPLGPVNDVNSVSKDRLPSVDSSGAEV